MKKKVVSKKTEIMPLGDRVLVRPFSEETLRKGKNESYGIILPESANKEKSAQGKILKVGEGKMVDSKLVPIRLKPGQTIMFSKYGYDEIEVDGEELYLIKEDNILAVIE